MASEAPSRLTPAARIAGALSSRRRAADRTLSCGHTNRRNRCQTTGTLIQSINHGEPRPTEPCPGAGQGGAGGAGGRRQWHAPRPPGRPGAPPPRRQWHLPCGKPAKISNPIPRVQMQGDEETRMQPRHMLRQALPCLPSCPAQPKYTTQPGPAQPSPKEQPGRTCSYEEQTRMTCLAPSASRTASSSASSSSRPSATWGAGSGE